MANSDFHTNVEDYVPYYQSMRDLTNKVDALGRMHERLNEHLDDHRKLTENCFRSFTMLFEMNHSLVKEVKQIKEEVGNTVFSMDDKLDKFERNAYTRFSNVEEKIGHVKTVLCAVDRNVSEGEQENFDDMGKRLDNLEEAVAHVERAIEDTQENISERFDGASTEMKDIFRSVQNVVLKADEVSNLWKNEKRAEKKRKREAYPVRGFELAERMNSMAGTKKGTPYKPAAYVESVPPKSPEYEPV